MSKNNYSDTIFQLQSNISRNKLAIDRATLAINNFKQLRLNISDLHISDDFLFNYLTYMRSFKINSKVNESDKMSDLRLLVLSMLFMDRDVTSYELTFWNKIFNDQQSMSSLANEIKFAKAANNNIEGNPSKLKYFSAQMATFAYLAKFDKKYIRAMQLLNAQIFVLANACLACDNEYTELEKQKMQIFVETYNKFAKILNPDYVPSDDCTFESLDTSVL